MQRFEGRVALVTGASRGIGFAIAERLLTEGASVVLTGRKQDVLDAAVAALSAHRGAERVLGLAGKVDDPEHRTAAIAATVERFGRIDHLVNNAGINPVYGPALEIELAAVHKILAVNVVAALEWTRDAVAAGLGTGEGASVLSTASAAGLAASPGIAFYGVSKAGLINLTAQLAVELAPRIRVNAVAPAVVRTRLGAALYEGREQEVAARYPLRRIGEPVDVAGPAVFLLSDDAAWVTGQTLVIDGGASVAPMG
ncbi:SDR family oxidoreductase [Cellulomonas wangsupingiae]|uniref:SDR family oxidoreductase n=1 Tax=Cellulomonas wangsupingiae TaxID=2968085 RepID=UPI001D0F13A7|nr:SDR family oxidoreductase [Cellulomonas wangsupingiae]MCM0639303.1 SDR family oxidoreductase [Cellulomonas wangsupingiae]